MKHILKVFMGWMITLVITFISLNANATTYYFAAGGDDANNGTSTSTPWKTLAKLNSFFPSLLSGDHVLFNRGDEFIGTIKPTKSFTAGNPLVIASYGTGAAPVISGLATPTWTSLGSNIWEGSVVSTLPTCNMVVVNGVNTPMGRSLNYPTYSTWFTHATSAGVTTIGTSLSGNPNWTNAELCIFTTTYLLGRHKITGQSGGNITYAEQVNELFQSPSSFFVQNYFIQNDIRTLDQQNEWFYNGNTHKLDIWSSSTPTGVQMATVDTLVYLNGRNYITFDNLEFRGANANAIQIANGSNIAFTNCAFNYLGRDGIYCNTSCTSLTVQHCSFNHINNCGIDLAVGCSNALITNNTVKNTGLDMGMTSAINSISRMGTAINSKGPGSTISFNNIDSIGLIGIRFNSSNVTVANNVVNHFCMGAGVKDDGGIYTWNGGATDTTIVGTRILNNMVMNSGSTTSQGIYLDEGSNGIEIAGNTTTKCDRGIYVNNGKNINIHNNISYDNVETACMLECFNTVTFSMTGITLKNNYFIAKDVTDRPLMIFTCGSTAMSAPFVSDSNYFARPINDAILTGNGPIQTYFGGTFTQRDLAGWKTLNSQDVHSFNSSRSVTSTDSLLFIVNPNSYDSAFVFTKSYLDIAGKAYNGKDTLHGYTARLLIQNGSITGPPANVAPSSNAGTDSTITLPRDSVHLLGAGTDPDGTIASYAWTKISGPGTTTILNPNNQNVVASGLQGGTYVFNLRVTDNLGATGNDQVTVIVNPANLPPTASAGTDQSITSPTSIATLTGTDGDVDGTIASRQWIQISGPNTAGITSATSASTGLTGLAQGTYIFQYTVTDNLGATASDITQVIVNPASDVPSTADAGIDQFVTVSNTMLVGFGADSDGTVASYSWARVSGPNSPTITSASTASTSVTGLINGVYVFRLTVTDNMGATASDNVQVTVNLSAPSTIDLLILHGKIKIQ